MNNNKLAEKRYCQSLFLPCTIWKSNMRINVFLSVILIISSSCTHKSTLEIKEFQKSYKGDGKLIYYYCLPLEPIPYGFHDWVDIEVPSFIVSKHTDINYNVGNLIKNSTFTVYLVINENIYKQSCSSSDTLNLLYGIVDLQINEGKKSILRIEDTLKNFINNKTDGLNRYYFLKWDKNENKLCSEFIASDSGKVYTLHFKYDNPKLYNDIAANMYLEGGECARF